LNPVRDRATVLAAERQRFEQQKIQRALRKINRSRWHQVPLLLLQEVTPAAVEVQGEKGRRETGMPTALNLDRLYDGLRGQTATLGG
jgi:hypothetical protein